MQVTGTLIPSVKLLRPARFSDARGFFFKAYCREARVGAGIRNDPVQNNSSLSGGRSVVRGLYFQVPRFAQSKLVRVVQSAILDVALNLRAGSPCFERHVAAVVSAAEQNHIYVPEGLAHGFCTLKPDAEVEYKVNRDGCVAKFATGGRWPGERVDQAVTWHSSAMKVAWSRMSRPPEVEPPLVV